MIKFLSSSLFIRQYWGNNLLVSFPPLNDMLKFSGFPSLTEVLFLPQ